MTIGLVLILGVAALLGGAVAGRWSARVWLGLTFVGAAALLLASVGVLAGPNDWEWRSAFPICGDRIHLRLDGLSAWFLALASTIGGLAAAYSREYWPDELYPASAPRGRAWWNILLLSMSLVVLSSNGLHFLVGWELFTVSAYFLITLNRERPEVRSAGWLYLAASHAGTVCLFAFFSMLAVRTGSWELGSLRELADVSPLFWLALAGFGLKAGMFPLHIWLPSAHASAPSHVSAMLSGVAIKLGVYGLVRFSGWLPLSPAAGWVLLSLGGVSALAGIAFAFAQNDLKRLLAYCSVENMGIILIGLGGALVMTSHAPMGDRYWAELAIAGTLLHVWNHGAFKALLFFAAGSVLHGAGTREMSRLGGLWRAMPWTAALFTLGAGAASGLPPLNGFVSEWLVYLGLLEGATHHHPWAGAVMPAAIVLAMAGALALATFVKAGAIVFLGAPRTRAAGVAHESGRWMCRPMLVLAGVCVAIGLAPAALWPALSRAVAAWDPSGVPATGHASLTVLGGVHRILAFVGLGGALALWHWIRSHDRRTAPTWDCGYATPAVRMQYTSGSFGGIASNWFRLLLQPQRTLRRPRGLLPADAVRLERTPETVLEWIVAPVAAGILQVSSLLRRLQHGRLQFYILYLVVGLLGLGAVVWFGGNP